MLSSGPIAPHPNAFIHLQKSEAKGRGQFIKTETTELQHLNNKMLQLVDSLLREISERRKVVQYAERVMESERKVVVNEHTRNRARIEDEWLRGLEKLLYITAADDAKRIKSKINDTLKVHLLPQGSAHTAVMSLAQSSSY